MISAGTQDAPPLHVTVHDRTGASLVIQYRDGKMEVLRNPLGVFTNQPLLQEQLQHYQDWMAAHNYTTDTKPKGDQWVMPGDYSSQSRFIRLAMIKTATSRECWPTTVMDEKQRLARSQDITATRRVLPWDTALLCMSYRLTGLPTCCSVCCGYSTHFESRVVGCAAVPLPTNHLLKGQTQLQHSQSSSCVHRTHKVSA
eukprot:GHUV01025254.1.p1 GENE.GHUV01025254.1~~GHUV01025254.1.p1  ORF type:complete len:199 (+),score=19.70 GHUV01025254.1:713-1309(+)